MKCKNCGKQILLHKRPKLAHLITGTRDSDFYETIVVHAVPEYQSSYRHQSWGCIKPEMAEVDKISKILGHYEEAD